MSRFALPPEGVWALVRRVQAAPGEGMQKGHRLRPFASPVTPRNYIAIAGRTSPLLA